MPRAATPIKKHTNGDGSIVWKAVVDAGPDPATGNRRQRRGTFATRKEAAAWLAATRTDVARGTYVAPVKITLGQHLDQWLAGRVDLKPSTARNYQDALRPIRQSLAAKPLQAVTKADLDGVVARMLDGSLRSQGTAGKPMSSRAVRLSLTVVSQALNSAVEEGKITRNVALLVKRPKQATARKEGWEPSEVEAFLAAADVHPFGAAFRLSLHGLRRGEVCGLRWSDVDLDAGTLRVVQSRTLVHGLGIVEGTPKSAASARTVDLGEGTTAALRRLRTATKEARVLAGPDWQDTGLVVVDALGRGVRPDLYSDLFARCAKAADVPLISLHQARHALVSYLLHKGVPVAVVQRMVGHADAGVTLSVYTHPLRDGSRDQVVTALAAVGL